MHIHITTTDGSAKFWLEPLIALDHFYNQDGSIARD